MKATELTELDLAYAPPYSSAKDPVKMCIRDRQCAMQMEIGRSTVTEIYESARGKIADSLINGRRLVIDGGNYKLCDGEPKWCYKKHCEKQERKEKINIIEKGDMIMRIAVTYENGEIFQHFGHTEQFKFYDAEDGKITAEQICDTNGSGHGALAGFLTDHHVDVLICGGIGGGAQAALMERGIKLYGGVSGSADEAVKALLSDTLSFNPNVHCNHHNHEHGAGPVSYTHLDVYKRQEWGITGSRRLHIRKL